MHGYSGLLVIFIILVILLVLVIVILIILVVFIDTLCVTFFGRLLREVLLQDNLMPPMTKGFDPAKLAVQLLELTNCGWPSRSTLTYCLRHKD